MARIKAKLLRAKELHLSGTKGEPAAKALADEFGGSISGNKKYFYRMRDLWKNETPEIRMTNPVLPFIDLTGFRGKKKVTYGNQDDTEVPVVVPHFCPCCRTDLHAVGLALSNEAEEE